jgi:hypothetical protein
MIKHQMTYKTKPREVNYQQRSDESQILDRSFHQKCPYSSADLEHIKDQIMVGSHKEMPSQIFCQ